MSETGFPERRLSSDSYSPCTGLFPSHKFQGRLATHYARLIYGGQALFFAGVVLAVIGFTAHVTPVAYLGPIVGSVGLCMATASCTVHKRDSGLRSRRVGALPGSTLQAGDTFLPPDSPREVYKQLAAAVLCMATFLGVIFLAVGLANEKNDGDPSLTLYLKILGPIFIILGVIGLVVIKYIDERDRKKLKRQNSTVSGKKQERQARIGPEEEMAGNVDDQSQTRVQTISAHINNNQTQNLPRGSLQSPLMLFKGEHAKRMAFCHKKKDHGELNYLNLSTAPSRPETPQRPRDSEEETQLQWQNAYTFTI